MQVVHAVDKVQLVHKIRVDKQCKHAFAIGLYEYDGSIQLVQAYYDVHTAQLGISVEHSTQSIADRTKIMLAELQRVQTDLELHSRQLGMKVEHGSQPLPAIRIAYVVFRQLRHILFPLQNRQKLIVVVQDTQLDEELI